MVLTNINKKRRTCLSPSLFEIFKILFVTSAATEYNANKPDFKILLATFVSINLLNIIHFTRIK